MKRNLDRPLTTHEIAAAAGTSERSLRRQFQCFTEQSPIALHRDLRLAAARHAICDKDVKADITTAAGLYGFGHLSHFTGQYRRRYGELPSATLHAVGESFLPLPSHATCDHTSLIVLPIVCAESEAAAAALAKMMTDLEIAALTRTRWINVLSPDDGLPTANDLRVSPSVRYAVRGRVQRIGGRVQAVLRVVDVKNGRQIWGNAFEGSAECAIELQQRVTESVAGALPACLRDTEATRGEPKPQRDPVAVRYAAQAFQAVLAMSQSANGRALEQRRPSTAAGRWTASSCERCSHARSDARRLAGIGKLCMLPCNVLGGFLLCAAELSPPASKSRRTDVGLPGNNPTDHSVSGRWRALGAKLPFGGAADGTHGT